MTSIASDAFLEVPGGRVFARTWTPPAAAGSPILLIHDSLGSVEQWRQFPDVLAARTRRTVIAYDRLGFGKSTPRKEPAKPSFIDDEAQVYLPAVADALGLGRFMLFGHSVGGGMALAAAAVAGSRCVAVVTESAQAFVEARTLKGIEDAEQGFRDANQFARLAKWHGDKARWVLDAWTDVWLSPAFRNWSLDPWLERVHCPVLALHGDSDEFGSEAFPHRIAEAVKGPSRMRLLVSCGHVPHREKEAEVLSHVDDFLCEHAVP